MKLLVAGGGTGGHVYPAIAIAKAFKKLDPNAKIDFVGTSLGIESRIVPKENFPLHLVKIGRLNSNVDFEERVMTLLKLPFAILKSIYLLFKLKPDVVLGVGGYASGPVVLMAALCGYRTYIWEPNAFPGMANRILSRFVKACFVAFEQTKEHLKAKEYIQCNVPIRPEIEDTPERVPETSDFCVLVFGGSQGSKAINAVVTEAICRGGDWLNGVHIVHQTGPLDFANIQNQYGQINHNNGQVECFEYLHDMPKRYQWADVVLCRAGISTIAELAAVSKASILVPLPTAADDHQRKNAESLVNKNAGICVLQSDFNPERFAEEITRLKNSPSEIAKLEKNIQHFHAPKAAESIANVLFKGPEL